MKMKQSITHVALVLILSCSAVAPLEAAENKPVELTADTIQYDSVTGLMTATGDIRMVQDHAVLTGKRVDYNSKTQEGHVTGGVQVVKDNAQLSAADLYSYGNDHMVATGNPILTREGNKLVGTTIDYYANKQYAIVTGGAKLTMPDGTMTATQIESFFNEQRAVAKQNVHIVSDVRKLDATADQAVYYGSKEQGKTILTGNAKAVQEGNVLTGSVMTLYLDDKKIDVQGRSKLVIIPQ